MTDQRSEKELDELFGIARDDQVVMPGHLYDRILADAAAEIADRPQVSTVPAGLFSRMATALGGWPALSGMAAATVAGIWIGLGNPALVSDLGSTLNSTADEVYFSNFLTGADILEEEEAG